MTRIETLAKFLECDVSELKEGYRENLFETENGEEYLVLTDDEADIEFYEYEKSLIEDLGLDAFSDWVRDYIVENCIDTDWFDEYMEEDYRIYCEDIETEAAISDEYKNRLEEEMSEADCENIEDYIEYLCNGYENSVEWFEFNFGKDALTDVVNEYNLLDIEKIIDYIKDIDNRGFLASYDGVENEEEEYFIYRIN